MKILFVSHEKSRNGSTVSMVTLIMMLKDLYGYEIDVLLPNHGRAENFLIEKHIPYKIGYYFNDFRVIGKRKRLFEIIKNIVNYSAVIRIVKHLKYGQYDYIISNSTAVDVGARIARCRGIKHVYYVREFMEEDFSFEYRNKKRMKQLFESSNKIIFISNVIAKKYISLYKLKNYRVIYNGINMKDYYIKNHVIFRTSILKIVQIGTFHDGKGTKESIELIKLIKDRVPCQLTLVGEGDKNYVNLLWEYINENNLEKNIKILPYENDIKSVLLNNDILLINSKSEAFGRVTIEGMAGGLLALGRDSGATGEIIEHEFTGMLFYDKKSFLEVMIDIKNNKEKYREMARQGQAYVLETYSALKNANNVREYLISG